MGEFGFKELIVWQKSMYFADACLVITDSIKGHYRLVEQIEGCACSVPQNIAEGKGRFSRKEFVHFLHISRGSLYEKRFYHPTNPRRYGTKKHGNIIINDKFPNNFQVPQIH